MVFEVRNRVVFEGHVPCRNSVTVGYRFPPKSGHLRYIENKGDEQHALGYKGVQLERPLRDRETTFWSGVEKSFQGDKSTGDEY